jgi:hypothetical protein
MAVDGAPVAACATSDPASSMHPTTNILEHTTKHQRKKETPEINMKRYLNINVHPYRPNCSVCGSIYCHSIDTFGCSLKPSVLTSCLNKTASCSDHVCSVQALGCRARL